MKIDDHILVDGKYPATIHYIENIFIFFLFINSMELNIRQNLLKNWPQLWIILEKYFSDIEILNVSNCRMNFDKNPSIIYNNIKQTVLIDTDNDCYLFENIFKYYPNLINIHLGLNQLSFISEIFVDQIQNFTNLSLSDNPTLKQWDPFINRLGKLKYLQELIINNYGIDRIKLPNQDVSYELFPSLKHLYMSDTKISSFDLINKLSRLSSLISLSILRNPIYLTNQIENETAKRMIIARLPNLTHLNRSLKPNINQTSKKVIFVFGDENEVKIEKQNPSSMTIGKLKSFIRRLFPIQLTNYIQFNRFVIIDKKHKDLMLNDYQDIQFYLENCFLNENHDRTSTIRIETVS
ncbi:unnamed protein product [Rotaria socialis]